jgi:SAM-dependent methyltransferase
VKYAPSPSCYEETAFSPLRIESITEQLRLLSYYDCRSILEIGVGKGVIRQVLKCFKGITHTTIDIEPSLGPDIVGSVLELPFANREFDCVLCCQVLEHLPFEDFAAALQEIHRISNRIVILSLPDKRRRCGLAVCLFRYGWRKLEFNFERAGAKKARLASRHYWEIGHTKATSGRNVIKAMRQAGFNIHKSYRLEKHQWHCFFVLFVEPASQAM